jgi:cytochrome P450
MDDLSDDFAMDMMAAETMFFSDEDERRAALHYVAEAFEEARLDGIEDNCVAMVAMFKSFAELVALHGEDAIAEYASGLPERILAGEFSTRLSRH